MNAGREDAVNIIHVMVFQETILLPSKGCIGIRLKNESQKLTLAITYMEYELVKYQTRRAE